MNQSLSHLKMSVSGEEVNQETLIKVLMEIMGAIEEIDRRLNVIEGKFRIKV